MDETPRLDEDFYGTFDPEDYLDHTFYDQNEFSDCYLSEDALVDFLTPPQESWRDFLPEKNEAIITMNSSKDVQWKIAKKEIKHVRNRVLHLLGVDKFENMNASTMLLYFLGPQSKAGLFLQDELGLTPEEFLKFMSTVLIQSAYHVSATQLFDQDSLLKDKLMIEEEVYFQTWKKIAEKKMIPPGQVSTNRREKPLWEMLETIVNEQLRNISVVGQDGRVSISLDDDKVWMNLSNSASQDLFGLRYTTHVKPNRKGIIAHTAVSTAIMIPLGIIFERTRDSTIDCFKRLLDFLFSQNGMTNLRNVSIHSDRGYMIPSLVFEYLLQSGAEVVGTVKRLAQCWPFTYKQKLNEADKRTLLDTKGTPTLFLKWCKSGTKHIFASAFRNGSDKIATAISTMHTQHHWEGIVLKENELGLYKKDKKSLIPLFFQRCTKIFDQDESEAEKEAMEWLLDEEVEPYTLRQGKLFNYE